MTAAHLRIIFFVVLIIGFSIVYAQAENEYKAPPSHVVETVLGGQNYYAGMTKDALYKIYPVSTQQNYYKKDNEEWIMFDNILTKDDVKDVIVFYLKDGLVAGWKAREVQKTPEERYKTVLERRKYGGSNISDSSGGKGQNKGKRSIYQPTRVNIYY